MMKPILTLVILLFSILVFSQENCNYSKKEIISIFKRINKSDASNIKNPEIRKNDFIRNFDTIIYLMNCSDFEIPNGDYSKKGIKRLEKGIDRTLIHIFQFSPERILNDSIINLFKSQLEISNLKQSTLITALSIYKFDFKDDLEKLKLQYRNALKSWGILDEQILK